MRSLLALAFPLLIVPFGAAAQTVRGTVVELGTERPLEHVIVRLIEEDGVVADSATTDAHGEFTLAAPDAGTYALDVRLPGYASQLTGTIELVEGPIPERRLEYQLVSLAAMHRMSEVIQSNERLQLDLRELCGGELRPWESGIVVGVVRDRRTRAPVPGARVTLSPPTAAAGDSAAAASAAADAERLASVADGNGLYVICHAPLGADLPLRVRADAYPAHEVPIEVRPGMIAWYDVFLRMARARR